MTGSTGGHVASVTLDGDRLVWDVQCHEPEDAPCRLACAEGCESWGDLDGDDDGWFHEAAYDVPEKHRMKRLDCCNVLVFLSEGGSMEELHEGGARSVLGVFPIEPIWTGEGYLWRRGDQ